jgi:type I restriction enzyme M protein
MMIAKQSLSKSDIKKVCDILRRDDGVGAKNYVEQLSWLLFLRIFENVEGELKELAEAEGKKYQAIIDQEYQWSTWAKKDWKDKDELIHFVNQKLFPYLKNLKGSKEKDKISEVFRELSGNLIRSAHNLLDIIDILNQIEMRHFQDTHLLSQVYEEILQEMGSEGGWAGEFYTPRPIIRLMIKIVNPKIGETIFDPFVGSGGFLVESFDYIQNQTENIGVREWDTLQNKTFSGQEKTPLPYLIGTMNMMLHRILVPNLTRSNTFMEDIHNLPESSKKEVILTNPPFGGTEHQSVQNNFPIPVGATEGLALQYVMKRLKNGGRCGIVLPELNILFGGGAMQKIRQELLEKFNVHSIISLPAGIFAQMGAGIKTNLIFFDKTGSTKKIWFGEVYGKFTKRKKIVGDSDLTEIFEKLKKREVSNNSWIVSIEEIKKNGFELTPKNPNIKNQKTLFSPEKIIDKIEDNQKEIDMIISSFKKIISE